MELFMKTFTQKTPTLFKKLAQFFGIPLYAGLMVVLMMPVAAVSQPYSNPAAVALGTAGTYGALASTGISGTATVNGDVGTETSTVAVTITATGTNWGSGNSHTTQAQTDLAAALTDANGRTNDLSIASALGGQTLTRGVYGGGNLDLASSATMTLDAMGDPSAVFIIKASQSLTINSGSTVSLANGAVWSNVFWYVNQSAIIYDGSTFSGIILAVQSITVNALATEVKARLLANTGSVAIGSTILPVELVSFTATADRMNTDLHWSTATEINNSGFEIQRRQTSDWAKVGFVAGAGTSNAPRNYSYTDNNLSAGSYAYRLKQIDNNGAFKYGSTVEVAIGSAPVAFALSQNYPNPFNPSTVISYQLPVNSQVTLKVYNMLGQVVATLVNGPQEAGAYTVSFNANKGTLGLSSGVYVYRLQAGSFISTKKLVLLK